MDSFTTQKSKPRKVKRPMKKSRVQTILDLIFQAIEIIVVMVTVAKLCYELVITLHDSGVAAVILANRTLAFVVGNAIIIALIAKSGLLVKHESKSNDLYYEFVSRDGMKNRGKQSETENEAKPAITETSAKQSEAEKETQSITENTTEDSTSDQGEGQTVTEKKTKKSIKPEKLTKQSTSVKRDKQSIVVEKVEKQSYQRTRSENLESLKKSSCGRLRRSETDASSERFESDDELRFKIESFIARQRRNQNDD